MEKTIGILTFEQFHGKQNIGSTRIRVKWPLRYWPEAEEYLMGRKYEVLILQKAYWLEGVELIRKVDKEEGKHTVIILDMCDADWLHWGYRIKQVIDLCDAVTTSTMELAKFLVKYTDKPVWCIPDRLDFEQFGDLKKDHRGNGTTKKVAWYGYSENFPMLDTAVHALAQLKIEELIVVANRRSPYQLPAALDGKLRLSNLPWSIETVNRDLLKADVVINPQMQTGRWKYKSNNKTINAWALGLPVATNKKELEDLMSEEARIAEGDARYKYVREELNVIKSVEEYKKLIEEVKFNL